MRYSIPPSPFQHVLQTNYTPSPVELKELRELVRTPEEQVRQLNEQISQLQAEREKLQSFIDGHRALLSLARRIPRDIIAEIFLHCLPTERLPVGRVGEAPLLLTTICRQWRDIALTTPRLWRAIHFFFPTTDGFILDESFRSSIRNREKGLELWLERAAAVGLTISYALQDGIVRQPRTIRDELREMHRRLLDLLMRYASQWKGLYFKNLPMGVLMPLSGVKSTEMPLLESLYSDGTVIDVDSQTHDHPLVNISLAPSLRILHVIFEQVDPLSLPVRWDGLTELTIHFALLPSVSYRPLLVTDPVAIIHRVAQMCQSLRKCTLHFNLTSRPDAQDVLLQAQIWEHLTELHLQFYHSITQMPARAMLQHFFNVITTPALSCLSVSLLEPFGVSQMEETPLISFLQRSGCQITSLSLNMPLSDTALVTCLEYMPSLNSLHLVGAVQARPQLSGDELRIPNRRPTCINNAFLQALTPKESLGDRVLCPRLEKVSLQNCEFSQTDALVALALARCGQGETTKLKSFGVLFQTHTNASISAEELAKIQPLKQNGIDVEWRSMHSDRLSELRMTMQRTLSRSVMGGPFPNPTRVEASMPGLIGEY